ncbi:MAG: PKD domain-containing protein [Saccharothrix sp.]|nr:PKD domain-containing protein [Saccharothrix sp.]
MRRTRRSGLAVVAALLGLLVTGVAHAAQPVNDDFDQATLITTLPFETTQSVADATQAADDPGSCRSYRSVWFAFTATATGRLTATTAGSDFDTTLSAYTGARGALSTLACNDDADGAYTSRVDIDVVAGTRYHLMVGSYSPGSTDRLAFAVTGPGTVGPANDAFAAAEPVTALPRTVDPRPAEATVEPDEPASVCASPTKSVWYAVTLPETTPVTLSLPSAYDARMDVYTGSALTDLTEVGCTWAGNMTFRAAAGTTYHVRLMEGYGGAPAPRLTIDVARPIQPSFSHDPEFPTSLTETGFANSSTIPDNSGPVAVRWDFGDGATAAGGYARHRFAADGDYRVTMTVEAADGRTATTSEVVPVRTHDVAITRFTTPSAATVGTTKALNVRVANTRYAEDVTVVLYRSTPSGWSEVGRYTQYVPASPTGVVNFPFNYTFRPDDATLGKVTFRAVATPVGVPDALPLDNEVISATTAVQPSATGGLTTA